jgi:hypothetical protein
MKESNHSLRLSPEAGSPDRGVGQSEKILDVDTSCIYSMHNEFSVGRREGQD